MAHGVHCLVGRQLTGGRGLGGARYDERIVMPNHGAARQGLGAAIGAELRLWKEHAPWAQRRDQCARLALTELDIQRLDGRVDNLLEALAQLCDYSGQYDAAADFRALSGQQPEPDRQLRLVQGQ